MRRRPPELNVAVQAIQLRHDFPTSTAAVSAGALWWTVDVRPTPLSREYRLKVELKRGRRPRVTVVAPVLIAPPRRRLPHTFVGDFLCLHVEAEWDGSYSLAATVVPWAVEWLLHYEVWLATDGRRWTGGGHEPPRSNQGRPGSTGPSLRREAA
jgi:hypothetical protein